MIKNLEKNNLNSNLSIRPYGRAKFNLPLEILNNSYENLIKSRKEVETGEKYRLITKKFQVSGNKISEFNKKNNLNVSSRKNIKEQVQLILNTKKIKLNKNISNNIPQTKTTDKNIINFNELIKNLNNLSKFNPYLAQSQHIYYFFNNRNNKLIKNISSIIEISFSKMYSLISKPVYHITPKNLNINLFIFLSNLKKNNSKFLNLKNSTNLEILSANLSKFSKKTVNFELNRIRRVFFDSNILANFIAARCEINKRRFSPTTRSIFNSFSDVNEFKKNNPIYNCIIPSFLTGMNIRIAGRLSRQKLTVRRTVKVSQIGGLTRRTADFVSKSRVTWVNKRGTFSITAKIGHKIHI